MSAKPSQLQHFYRSHRETHDVLQQAAFIAGLLKDERTGEVCQNPLTAEEIKRNAESDRHYAWAFKIIHEGRLKNELAKNEHSVEGLRPLGLV